MSRLESARTILNGDFSDSEKEERLKNLFYNKEKRDRKTSLINPFYTNSLFDFPRTLFSDFYKLDKLFDSFDEENLTETQPNNYTYSKTKFVEYDSQTGKVISKTKEYRNGQNYERTTTRQNNTMTVEEKLPDGTTKTNTYDTTNKQALPSF